MAELKTKPTKVSVKKFLNSIKDNQKQEDSFKVLEMMKKITKEEPKMWGPSIIGFGMYHYKSERSSQQGDWPLVGFSPRKAAISLYIRPFESSSRISFSRLDNSSSSLPGPL